MILPDFNDVNSQSASYRSPEPYSGVDAMLSLRFETKQIWPRLHERFGLDETGSAIALDIYAEALTTGRCTSYSRRKAHYAAKAAARPGWQARDALYTFNRILPAVEALEEKALIENFKAPPGTRGWQSKMRATPALIDGVRDLIRTDVNLVAYRPAAGLLVRDADGEQVPFACTDETTRIERNVATLNEGFSAIRLEGAFPACAMRICNQSLERGGRFYLEGGSIQIMPESQRLRVTWDGEPSAEVDYKTMHVSMLYSDAGVAPPEDSYTIPGFPRKLVKVAVMAVINAPTYKSALGAIASSKHIAPMAYPRTTAARKIAAALIDALKVLHRPIATAFHSGAGAYLMRREADVLEDVMLTMQGKGEVVLPIHDSGLCRISAVRTLEQVMIESAEKAGLKRVRIETATAVNDH